MSVKFAYLIEARSGEVKIGCSASPSARAASIAQSSPCEVRLIAQWPATFRDERAFHQRFSDCRTYREWFTPTGSLANFVDQMRGIGVSEIADWNGPFSESQAAREAAKARNLSEKHKANWADPEYRARRARWAAKRRQSATPAPKSERAA